ncbi:solute carrier family 25 member 32b isoform X3 [Narcine bancroftii]|uniref:solute carrier family 25 member 32b isoform X3 n=1 Tax=Narcine bancroftii TaxID=1343680 RepID=UPI0038315E39
MSMGGPDPEPGAARPPDRRRRLVKYEDLAAGVSGGVLSTLVLHPLDLVKVRFAVSDGLEMRPRYNGIVHCIKSIWKVDGIQGLYQGVTPNVMGAGLSWGLYFFFYNAIKAYKQDGFPTPLSATQHLISAAQAGAMTLCITNPIWVTKTRLVLQYDAAADPSKRQYKGMFHALLKIYQNEGIRGLYKNTLEYITMAALSKVFAVSATYPYQVIRARLQDQHTQYSGVMNAIWRTWSNEGIRGFYKGVLPNVVKVTPACCITFLVYENVLQFLLDLRTS